MNYVRTVLVCLIGFFGAKAPAQIKTLNGKTIAFADMDKFISRKIDSLNIPSASVAFINNGKIVYSKAYGLADVEHKIKADENTVYEAASISKIVFAYFIMRMVDKGVIDLDAPLYKYLPYKDIEYDERYKLFTARMVLSHTTGLPNWHEWQPADPSRNLPKGAQYIMFTPGTQFSYSGEGYQYLSWVIAHLLKTDMVHLSEIVHEEVCKPLAMEHADFSWNDYIKTHRANGYFGNDRKDSLRLGELKRFDEFSAPGGLRTNAADYAKFMIGIVEGKGLSKKSATELLSNQATVTDAGTARDAGEHWGLGVAIKTTPYGIRYWHNGSNGDFTSEFEIFKDSKSGFVVLTNSNSVGELWDQLEPYFREGKNK
jgi:CubicO group peptidase (beta-lactamase class C family)